MEEALSIVTRFALLLTCCCLVFDRGFGVCGCQPEDCEWEAAPILGHDSRITRGQIRAGCAGGSSLCCPAGSTWRTPVSHRGSGAFKAGNHRRTQPRVKARPAKMTMTMKMKMTRKRRRDGVNHSGPSRRGLVLPPRPPPPPPHNNGRLRT